MTFTIRSATAADYPALLEIWLRSVRATHTFLTEADIDELTPLVRDLALPNLQLHILIDATSTPAGWMGMDGNKIEALFLDPPHFGQGGGRQLVEHAAKLHPELLVDVNEQNPAAVAFYRKLSFTQYARSERDGQGKPFPLLHLRRPATLPSHV